MTEQARKGGKYYTVCVEEKDMNIRPLQGHPDNCFYIAPHIEITHHLEGARFQVVLENIKNHVGRRLMRDALVAKTVQIEFQTFEFYNSFIRGVGDLDGRKIGIP